MDVKNSGKSYYTVQIVEAGAAVASTSSQLELYLELRSFGTLETVTIETVDKPRQSQQHQ